MAAVAKLIHLNCNGTYYQYPVVFSDELYNNYTTYKRNNTSVSNLGEACSAVDAVFSQIPGLTNGFWQTINLPVQTFYDPDANFNLLMETITPLCSYYGKFTRVGSDDWFPVGTFNLVDVSTNSGSVGYSYGNDYTNGLYLPADETSAPAYLIPFGGVYCFNSSYYGHIYAVEFQVFPENCLVDGKFIFDNIPRNILRMRIGFHCELATNSYYYFISNRAISYIDIQNYKTNYPDAYNTYNNYDFPAAPEPEPTDTDPYSQGGNSGEGGGTGDFDGTSDSVGIPGLPSLSATDTGFITLFNPSLSELQGLASYMWGSLFDISTFKKIFADPIDCILGLSIVPVSVPNGASKEVKVGNIGTGINMTTAAQQYVEVNCGTINVNEFWGSYLDYSPYTKAEIYLPYIGTHAISVDDIMGKSVQVVYHIDILSGACNAYVKCGSNVLYEFIGQCSSSIPINGNDWTNVINGVLNIAGNVGSMVATGGATAPMAAVGIASTAVNSFKPDIEKSGSLSGTGGMLAIQKPYLILTRPKQALPNRQNSFIGYPSFTTKKMGNLQGYTVVESTHLQGIPATEEEYKEIETILKDGVIF